MRRYLLLIVLIIGFSAIVTYSILLEETNIPKTENDDFISRKENNDLLEQMTEISVEPEKIVVDQLLRKPRMTAILERHYNYCGHTITEKLPQNSPLLALTADKIIKLYPDWQIREKQSEKITLYREIDDFCPKDLAQRYVGIKDNYVAIFFGKVGMYQKIFKVTEIPINSLPVEVVEQLRKGIQSKSEDHLITVIEGLSVYYYE